MKNRPPYAITSVDHALHLAQVLGQEGSLSVSEAAELLGVARSTAHRLFAMLVYRDFAQQQPDRRYHPGPALNASPSSPTLLLRRAALPHMDALVAKVEETANLQVRTGTDVRFVASVECSRFLRVGDRSGKVMPAHLVAGGKELLAALSQAELAELYAGSDIDLRRLRKQLALARQRGYGLNQEDTELGVSAVGVPIAHRDLGTIGALSLAIPSARFTKTDVREYVTPLTATARDIADSVARA